MRRFHCILAAGFLAVAAWSTPAEAAMITFEAVDLADSTQGEDLWRFDYVVTGFSFSAGEGFDIFFDETLFASLSNPTAPNADWDPFILQQPSPGTLEPFNVGIFDAFALTDNPALDGVFSVEFVFLGSGAPGAQPFEIFNDVFEVVESGFTKPATAPIPEPSTTSLVLLGLVGLGLARRRGRRRV